MPKSSVKSRPAKRIRRPAKTDLIDEIIGRFGEDLLTLDGFDDCIIGVVERAGLEPIVCYDRAKVLQRIAKDMSPADAREYFEFNLLGSWVGERTPCFLERVP